MWKFLLMAVLTASIYAGAQSIKPATQLVLLGTGTPNADPDRSGPAVAIVVNDVPYVIDSGPGVVRRASAANRNGVKGLAVANLRRLFLTHLHSDHTAGLPDFIFTPAVLERDSPLLIFGPPGTREMTSYILKAYRQDLDIRLKGLEPAKPKGYDIRARDVFPGEIYRDENVTVKAFKVNHGSWNYSYGYRFDSVDRSIVISGDCAPSESIIKACNGCDVLVHEVYSEEGFAKRPPEWQRYHSKFHTSSSELADIASKARPRLLILYHQLMWGASKESILKEIAGKYHGKVVFADDLDVY